MIMSNLVVFIVFCQALGAVIGAGTAVWSELAYVRAMRDGKIDHAERVHLKIIAHGLRFGMTLLLLASFALVIVSYLARVSSQPALTTGYWALIVFALLILGVSVALSRKIISFALGSAIVFSAWWFLTYLTLGQISSLSFGVMMAFFIVATAIFYAILQYTRMLAGGRK